MTARRRRQLRPSFDHLDGRILLSHAHVRHPHHHRGHRPDQVTVQPTPTPPPPPVDPPPLFPLIWFPPQPPPAKSVPPIAWPPPADIVYGTPMGPGQLDATADVPGTFTYSPPPGTVLHAGDDQILTVSFTPYDSADYTTTSSEVTINVQQAVPTISWPAPADIVYGTPLGSGQLDASRDVPGTFTYSPPPGTVLGVGDQPLMAQFTPYDTTDYTEATAVVNLTVTPSINYGLTNGDLYRVTDGQSVLIASGVSSFAVTSDSAVAYLEQDGTLLEQAVSGGPQLLDRLVNSFQLMPNGQISVVNWFDNNLTVPAICNLARTDFIRDEAITYSDMLGLFNQVLQGGPETNSEAQDLRTIVAGTRSLNLPGYVYDLANKVVNPSNADLAYLASYYSGDPSISTLQELVNQWFLGTVQPNAVNVVAASQGNVAFDPSGSYTFPGATGNSLFGASGPEYWDVAQGSAGDCWFLAALAETAARDPAPSRTCSSPTATGRGRCVSTPTGRSTM